MKLLQIVFGFRRIVFVFTVIAAIMSPIGSIRAAADPPGDPGSGPGTAPPNQVVSWRQLGQSDKIVLTGSNQSNDVALTLPSGATATSLTGQIGSVVNVAAGRVDVLDSRGILLGSIPVPIDAATVPFTVDTSAAAAANDVVKLSFVLRDTNPPANGCAQLPSVTLAQLATTFSGQSPSPTAVSDFRPGYLSQIVIWVGPDAPQDVQQAALSLVARLSALYRPIPVRIDVDTAPEPQPAPSADARLIEITQGQRGMTVRNGGTAAAALVITGHGTALQDQVALFTDRRVDLAQTPTATVTSVSKDVAPSTRTLTFDQLGMASQISVLGTSTLYTGFDASAFGIGSIDGAQLHLIARYTPVLGGEGSVLLRSGSTVLASHTLDSTGVLDLTADIPVEVISSKTGLALDVQYVPRQECPPLTDRLTFALDPGSTVSVTPGTANRGGFPALPMAFTPEFAVTLGNSNLISYAAQVINLMGQRSAAVLHPMVRSVDEAVHTGSPLLIVGDSQLLAKSGLKAPIQPGAGNFVTINGETITAVDLNGPVGAVQVFTDQGHMVLAVGGTGDWSLVDRSLDYIRYNESGWESLTGDVVATGAKNATVNLTVRQGGPIARRPVPGDAWRWWAWATVGVAALAALAFVVVFIARWHRRDDA